MAVSTSEQQAISLFHTSSFTLIAWNVVSRANQCDVWESLPGKFGV